MANALDISVEPKATRLSLLINDPDRAYTNGDTISGTVELDVSKHHITISKAIVRLLCVERNGFFGPEETQQVTHYDAEVNVTSRNGLASANTHLHYGIHRFPFHFLLAEDIRKCPGTFSLKILDKVDTGIWWTVEARVEIENVYDQEEPWFTVGEYTSVMNEKQVLVDKTELIIHPFDREAELQVMRNSRPLFPLQRSNDIYDATLLFERMKIELLGLPTMLPQTPEAFSFTLLIEAYESVFLRDIEVSVRVVAELRSKSAAKAESICEALGTATLEKEICSEQLLCCHFKNCTLDNQYPSEFEGSCVKLRYLLELKVNEEGKVSNSRNIQIPIASPSRLRNALEKDR